MGVSVVCHGDDFTALGTNWGLDQYERGMLKCFDCELRGRLGSDPEDMKEVKILNRILRVTDRGLSYEADPRHGELLARALGLESCGRQGTPGSKDPLEHEIADGVPEHEDGADAEVRKLMCSLKPKVRDTMVKFSDHVEVFEAHAAQYPLHVKDFVFEGPVGNPKVKRLPPGHCQFTGLPQDEAKRQRQLWRPQVEQREYVLHDVLISGAAWEVKTSEFIAALSATHKKKKFTKKRVGSKKAKRYEQLDAVGDVLTPEERTLYRALSARAMYLALDRPDIQYAAKELCREFAMPTSHSIVKLKRLVRYIVHKPRVVWLFNYESESEHLDVFSDTDFGGCTRTRRSTSGGVARLGSHVIKAWSKTQATVALSSAEAELTGICAAASEGLGLQALCNDLGVPLKLRVHSDAAAAIGICRRRGLGRVRHLAVADLWIQDRLRTRDFELLKVPGAQNVSDIMTKYVDKACLEKHMQSMGLVEEEGRARSAAKINPEVVACCLARHYDPYAEHLAPHLCVHLGDQGPVVHEVPEVLSRPSRAIPGGGRQPRSDPVPACPVPVPENLLPPQRQFKAST